MEDSHIDFFPDELRKGNTGPMQVSQIQIEN